MYGSGSSRGKKAVMKKPSKGSMSRLMTMAKKKDKKKKK